MLLFKSYIINISFHCEQEFFKLTVAAFENLSHVSGRRYEKALTILEKISKIKIFLIMLDLECDDLVIEMFQQFLRIIRLVPLHNDSHKYWTKDIDHHSQNIFYLLPVYVAQTRHWHWHINTCNNYRKLNDRM